MNTNTIICVLCSIILSTSSAAQKITELRKGCARVQGNLAGGYLFEQKQYTAYVTGDADYFIENRVSLTGSAWYALPLRSKNVMGIRANHAVLGGFNYHFTQKGMFDPYAGITPGLGLVQVNYQSGEAIATSRLLAAPLLSASVGCNVYIGSIFHFFAKVQGVTGQVFKDLPAPGRLDELKVTAGLGFNARLRKPKTLWEGLQ
jgi:hypothetical protein